MRLGMIGRCDRTGLGMLTMEFHKHMSPAATLLLDVSENNPGNRFHIDDRMRSQYTHGEITTLRPRGWPGGSTGMEPPERGEQEVLHEFLDSIDVLYTSETPYWYWLFEHAPEHSVRTVLHYNYEFLDYLRDPTLPRPDVLLAPSLWHLEDLPPGLEAEYLPFPIPTMPAVAKPPERPLRVLHIAGTHTDEDRNGTRVLAEAIPKIHTPNIRFLVTGRYKVQPLFSPDARLGFRTEVTEYWMPYLINDILVMPRRFGGLCLPLNEALGAGLPVLMPDISPQNDFLPEEMLFDAGPSTQLMTRALIDVHEPSSDDLAAKLTYLSADRRRYDRLKAMVPMLAERWTWAALKPEFERVFETVHAGG